MNDRNRHRHHEKPWMSREYKFPLTAVVKPQTVDAIDDVAFVLGQSRSAVMRGIIEQWQLDNADELRELQKFSDGTEPVPQPHEMEFGFLLPGLIDLIDSPE